MIIPKPFKVLADLLEAFSGTEATKVQIAGTDKEHEGLLTLQDQGAGGWSRPELEALMKLWGQTAGSSPDKPQSSGVDQGDNLF
jgi:hypothetical protein